MRLSEIFENLGNIYFSKVLFQNFLAFLEKKLLKKLAGSLIPLLPGPNRDNIAQLCAKK